MKVKYVVAIIGAIFVIPTSVPAAQWAMAKFSKKLLNCVEDSSRVFNQLDLEGNSGHQAQELANLSQSITECRKNVDTRMGNINFIKEEVARAKASQKII